MLYLSLIKLLQNQQGCNFYASQCTSIQYFANEMILIVQ